ncbi:exonuclease [Romboutsia maritimum]|uniref:Exonuclease n=1 Tax=Romboutsia maritimum TaxID=2020948 RepID=A0A371IQC3_9FIRM|nr:3'-5' exonuclease [Romboutsia maritimum]RDY22671.1 exonuclease [Romboutsia maritimum]
MKKIYIDFEMNMPNTRSKINTVNTDLIAIGAIQYDTNTKKLSKFKSLIKPITNSHIYPHIQELTQITNEELNNAPTYEEVMRKFKQWLGEFSEIQGIYTFGNLDLTCFNNTDKISSRKYNHPRFLNNIRDFFIDVKDKYLDCGIKCMNYISLKNLLEFANIEFKGDAHDPLNDAYNLFILDETLETNENIRELLIIQDLMKSPFINLNYQLSDKFETYKKYLYKQEGEYDLINLSIDVINTIMLYIQSLIDIDINSMDTIRDIKKKIDTIEKIKNIKNGYFYVLENVCLDMKDLLDDLMLYKLKPLEYKEELKNIINLFEDDLSYEGINKGINIYCK